MLPFPLLGLLLAIGGAVAIFGPIYYLLCGDMLLSYFQGFWTLGGTRVDYTDLMIACLAVALVLRGRKDPDAQAKIPYLGAWLTLALFLSAAYLVAPQNQRNLTDPIRIGYQLYRYCWKPLLYFPIALMLLRDSKRIDQVLMCMLVGVDICAMVVIKEGFSGVDAAAGPFGHGNAFASITVTSCLVAFSQLFYTKSKVRMAFCGFSFLILMRAVLFSESRAGLLSILMSVAFFCGLMTLMPSGRSRLGKFTPLLLLAPILVLILKPDILKSQAAQHAISVTEGSKAGTMQWRMKERWPHFMEKAKEKPILGTGTAVDLSLGDSANTPHNGYIALAVRHGFPVAILYIFFGFGALINGVIAFFKTRITRLKIFAAMTASPMVGILAHNMIESTITAQVLLQNMFWLFIGLNAIVRFYPETLVSKEELAALERYRDRRQDNAWENGWWVTAHGQPHRLAPGANRHGESVSPWARRPKPRSRNHDGPR